METTLKPYYIMASILNALPSDDAAFSMHVAALVFHALGQNNNMSNDEIIDQFASHIKAIHLKERNACVG